MALRAVYTSPLWRARETAAVVAEPHRIPVVVHEGLREIGVGEWEGLLVTEIEQRYAEALRQWWDRPHLTRIPGGETLEELRERGVQAIVELRARHPDEAIAVVAHGGVNKTILLEALGAPLSSYWRLRQGNACVNLIQYEGDRARVLIINETAHLAALLAREQVRPGAPGESRHRIVASDSVTASEAKQPPPETW